MSGLNFQELTRRNSFSPNGNITEGVLQVSALLRIAEATEKIAVNYDLLLKAKEKAEKERDLYWIYFRSEQDENKKLNRRISALRGVITKLQNQLKEKE